jgi:hypothetical protein
MNTRKIASLLEDRRHLDILNICNDVIVPELNNEYSRDFRLNFPYDESNLRGKADMLVNKLPSSMYLGKRFLVMVDYDNYDEATILDWVNAGIDGVRTRGTFGVLGNRIKTTERTRNIIRVLVGGDEKIIVVLPIGLLTFQTQFINSHSGEDYILEQAELPNGLSGNQNSKQILSQMELSSEQELSFLKSGIEQHKDEIKNYLKPLWEL